LHGDGREPEAVLNEWRIDRALERHPVAQLPAHRVRRF